MICISLKNLLCFWNREANARRPASYQVLEQKKVVDPSTFQITDTALDKLAPVTECDARVVHVQKRKTQESLLTDYYLLDEVAVKYRNEETGHLMGIDMDTEELIAFLARRLVPRQSKGDLLLVDLTPVEVIALAHLLGPLRETQMLLSHRLNLALIDQRLHPAHAIRPKTHARAKASLLPKAT